MRRELFFGFAIMGLIVAATLIFTPWASLTNGHLGLIMLALVVVAIMLGFPTAFTLMGMGMIFAWFAYHTQGKNAIQALSLTLDLMVQRTYGVMANDVLISIPLFVFMGYLVERANLIEKLFRSLHLALARVPGSLAVATLVTCAIFATATGIVGAVVTLMGLLALPTMLRSGYSVQLSAGAITAGGCLGILIPPSVLLILYGATAGESVVKLYAGAFFPGLMLAGLYIAYVIILAWWKPELAPPLPLAERQVPLPDWARSLQGRGHKNAVTGLLTAFGGRVAGVNGATVMKQLAAVLLPALVVALMLGLIYRGVTAPVVEVSTAGLQAMGGDTASESSSDTSGGGVQEPPLAGGVTEPPADGGVQEPPKELSEPVQEAAKEPGAPAPTAAVETPPAGKSAESAAAEAPRVPAPTWFWIFAAISIAAGRAAVLPHVVRAS